MNSQERTRLPIAANDDDADATGAPDVSSDRSVPPAEAPPGRVPSEPRKPPLDIKQIEEIEDDAPGG